MSQKATESISDFLKFKKFPGELAPRPPYPLHVLRVHPLSQVIEMYTPYFRTHTCYHKLYLYPLFQNTYPLSPFRPSLFNPLSQVMECIPPISEHLILTLITPHRCYTLSGFEPSWTQVKSLHVLHARHCSKGTGYVYIQLVCILTVLHVYTCMYLSRYSELTTLAFSVKSSPLPAWLHVYIYNQVTIVMCIHILGTNLYVEAWSLDLKMCPY